MAEPAKPSREEQPNAPPAADGGGEEQPGGAPGDPLKAALAERDALSQKWLMAVADLDNYRRRVQKEFEQDRRYAALPLARDVLPALDNLHRALDAARNAGENGQLVQGVQMVAKQFDDILAKHAIVPIAAVDKPFDPNLHMALQQLPAPDKPPLTVLAECERGYTLYERVVRPSTVIVSAPTAEPENNN